MNHAAKISIVLILTTIFVGKGQIPFYDALSLRDHVHSDNKLSADSIVYGILDKYYKPDINNTESEIKNAFNAQGDLPDPNPFIEIIGASRSSEKAPIGELLKTSPISGLNVTTIADGLAKFMVERTKQELNAWFFERFKNQIKETTELKILFPTTSLHLEAIGSEIYNYNAYLTGLRESFEQDLSALLVNLPELLDHPDYKNILDSNPEIRYIMKTAMHVVNQLNSNVHPGDIIHGFPPPFGVDKSPVNLYSGIRVVDLFSQSLRFVSEERYWISLNSLKFLADENVFRIYLGLIYQQMDTTIVFKTVHANGDTTLINFRNEFAKIANYVDDISKYRQFVQELGSKAETAELALKKIRETKGEKGADPKDIYAFMHASIGLIDFSTKITELPYSLNSIPDTAFVLTKEYIKVAENGADLYLNISERNYGTAIVNVLQIIDAGLSGKLENLQEVKDQIFKYGTFMASVVQAENSDEVKTIIESVALPPGSFRTKRESKFNFSMNSYLGFTAGWEIITNADNKWHPNNFALSAPVGLSLSWGGIKKKDPNKKNAEKGSANGMFLSVIDIGALASFRFADESSAVVSTVELKNVLAPGLFYTHSFRNAPISLLIGGQMGPLLRDVSAIDFKPEDNIYYRVGFSLVVDIPILNFYNKPE